MSVRKIDSYFGPQTSSTNEELQKKKKNYKYSGGNY